MVISVIGDMKFGQKLRRLRLRKGLSQQQLAERLAIRRIATFLMLRADIT
ncbi:MAG: hypothetical protein ACTSYM_09090 [Candidatus Baldrarchaeia archaeon]